ncbi:MAG: indolepyruvate oxidoreductase subunit beta family protein [Pseudomonadales bacterium]
MSNYQQSINIIAAALGGQGGAVFTNWLIDVAESNDWVVQSTSLAGVAQRTGATIYYIEMMPRSATRNDLPVLSLFPSPGDIDIAICSELSEAGRMLQRGFITPERTALITSSNRVYSISEKIQLADGTINPEALADTAKDYAKQMVAFDMQKVADESGSVISSVLLGAIAGAGVLPFDKNDFIASIEKSGKAVASSVAAFNVGFERAAESIASVAKESEDHKSDVQIFEPTVNAGDTPPENVDPMLAEQVASDIPEPARIICLHGIVKATEYQDVEYAEAYLAHIKRIAFLDDGSGDYELTQHAARYLALWMCFEDVPRVAQLKLRATRMNEIRQEVGLKDESGDDDGAEKIMYVTEFFKPRVEEMCAILPAAIGERLMASSLGYKFLNLFSGGKKLRTNTVSIFLALRFLASLRRFRRGSMGYKHEHALIQQWLTAIEQAAEQQKFELAKELAQCGRIVKGYGNTRERTSKQVKAILNANGEASLVSALRTAALADDQNEQFSKLLLN